MIGSKLFQWRMILFRLTGLWRLLSRGLTSIILITFLFAGMTTLTDLVMFQWCPSG